MILIAFATGSPAQNPVRIDLDQAIQLALAHNPALKAAQTTIAQSKAVEVTAGLRPNPVLLWDSQFIPLFSPGSFSLDTLDQTQQFDAGIGYLFERGGKRQARLRAARDQTAVTQSQVADFERGLVYNVAQQFINVLLAESNLRFALENLKSYQDTADISAARLKAGDISEGDFLKIKLQLLQFQTDVSAARLARVQGLASLREFLGYDAVPADYDVIGSLAYEPLRLNLDDLRLRALRNRPDLRSLEQGVTAAESQHGLARANGKWDLNATASYSHVSGVSGASFFFNLALPVFNRNQGEIARTRYAVAQAQDLNNAGREAVMTDVVNAYETVRTNSQVLDIYTSGYLAQAQESRDISAYAFKRGGASLLDFLDAERSYRSTQLSYRQALASYMLSLEQLRQSIGTRNLQ